MLSKIVLNKKKHKKKKNKQKLQIFKYNCVVFLFDCVRILICH